jgi:hypothetical protein
MAQNPLLGMLKPTREQQIADSYINQIEQGDRSALDPLGRFLSAQEAIQADDPMQQRYRKVTDAQTDALVYNEPSVRGMREDQRGFELEKATAPARTQGQYAVEAANTKGQAQFDALQQMLQGGVQPGRSISVSGAGSIRQAAEPRRAQAPASVTNRLLTAQQKVANPGMIRSFFGAGPSKGAQTELQGVLTEISRAEGIPIELLNDAVNVATANPTASPEQLLQQVDGDDLSDQEREWFLTTFARLR